MTNISNPELDRLKQAVQELTVLNRIASTINVTMDLPSITHNIIAHCIRHINASQGAVFLLDEEESKADKFKTLVREIDPHSAEIPLRLNQTLTGWMAKNKSVLVCNQPDTDDRFGRLRLSESGIKSILAAPLQSRHGIIGVLAMFNKKEPSGFDESDKRFLAIVGSQTAQVIDSARLSDKLNKVEQELRVAHVIQTGLLPREDLKTAAVDVCGSSLPAKEVGGDFYDIHAFSQSRIFVSIGDVADKGMPAALLMAYAQALVRSNLVLGGRVALPQLATTLNRVICQFASPGQFITGLFGFVDITSRTFSYINCGHPFPVVVRCDGTVEQPDQSDLILGVDPDYSYTQHDIKLDECSMIFLYSDGVNEAYSEQDTLFGEDRLVAVLSSVHRLSAPEIRDAVVREVTAFRGNRQQSDDLSMVIVKFHNHRQ